MVDEVLRMRATVVSEEAITSLRALGKELGLTGKNVNLKPVDAAFSGLRKTITDLSSEIKNAATPALGSLGFTAAGAGLSLYGIVNAARGAADRVLNLRNASNELGLSVRHIRAFQSAAEDMAIAPESALQGLITFNRNAEDFKMNIGDLRDRLRDLGAGDVVERINAAVTPLEKLHVAFERMQYLMKQNPAAARRFAQDMFGSAEFARLGWDEFLKVYEKTGEISQHNEAALLKMRGELRAIGNAWEDLTIKLSGDFAPGITRALQQAQDILGWFEKIDQWREAHGWKQKQVVEDQWPMWPGMPTFQPNSPESWFREGGPLGKSDKKPSERYQERIEREGVSKTPWWEGLKSLFHKSSLGIDEKDATKEGTKQGVIEGLTQYAALAQGGAGGGIMNAAFDPGTEAGGQRGVLSSFKSGGGFNMLGLTRGDRNNNPGNLKFGPLAKSMGATGADDRGFAIFPDRATGEAAQEALIKSDAYKGLTLQQFGTKYAEGSRDWINTVGKELGIGPGDVVNNQDPRLAGAIRKAEGTSGAVAGDNPTFTARVKNMIADAAKAGVKIGMGGGFRTRAEQARLFAMKPGLAAPPGHSLHELGLARDLTFGPGGSEWAHQHAGEYGLRFPMSYEPWHIQPKEGRGLIDQQIAQNNNVNATGTVNLTVHAPKGTKVSSEADGLWQTTTIKNYRQMQPTEDVGRGASGSW